MHYHVVVLLEPGVQPSKEAVEALMEPHQEEWHEDPTDPDEGKLTGHWDWWRIGGRWDGALYPEQEDKHECADFHCGYSSYHQQLGRNARPVADLLEGTEEWIHALVLPSGEWHEGVNVWEHPEFPGFDSPDYGQLRDRLEAEWRCQVRRLLVEHNACTAVSTDIHS